ncbi:MAG: peptidoglycan-associated lipoprotein Pal [bacterium]
MPTSSMRKSPPRRLSLRTLSLRKFLSCMLPSRTLPSRRLSSYALVLLLGGALAGCGGGGALAPAPEEVEVEINPVEGIAGDTDATATGLGDDSAAQTQGLDDASSADSGGGDALLAQRVVYFEYDSSALTAAGQAAVRAHARHLRTATGTQVVLEGHADERGTREYNLALAEDRAKSVADLMQAFGVESGRIQTVSYGEERPVALGHDEASWHLNRRVEILY